MALPVLLGRRPAQGQGAQHKHFANKLEVQKTQKQQRPQAAANGDRTVRMIHKRHAESKRREHVESISMPCMRSGSQDADEVAPSSPSMTALIAKVVSFDSMPAKLQLVHGRCAAVLGDGSLLSDALERAKAADRRSADGACAPIRSLLQSDKSNHVLASQPAQSGASMPTLAAPPGLALDSERSDSGLGWSRVAPAKATWSAAAAGRRSCLVTFPGYCATRDAAFDLVPRLIGRSGSNVKEISAACDGKVQIRGYGSGQDGSSDLPLHLKLSCKNPEKLDAGKQVLLELLNNTSQHFARFCRKQGAQAPQEFFAMQDQAS